jgi:hypothetical protein
MKNLKNDAFWTCVIGPADRETLPDGADYPLRNIVSEVFEKMVGNYPNIVKSGWGSASEKEAEANLSESFVYAVEDVYKPKPKLRELTSGELLTLLTNFAKDYHLDGTKSVIHNAHMNRLSYEETVEQKVLDAVLVDFINYIGSRYGVDYGLYTKNLNDDTRKIDLNIKNK